MEEKAEVFQLMKKLGQEILELERVPIYGYVYLIETPEGHKYVGRHKSANGILDENYWGSGRKINDYYKTHDKNLCKRHILSYAHSDEGLSRIEEAYIKSWKPDFNISMSTNSYLYINRKGHKHSEETKNKIRLKNTGFHHSEKSKKKMSKSQKERVRREGENSPLKKFKKGHIPWNKGKKTGLVPKTAFRKGMKSTKFGGYYDKEKQQWI